MNYTQEQYDKISDIKKNGGYLWAIERTDTHEFLQHHIEFRTTHDPRRPRLKWDSQIHAFTRLFLSKEDAEKEAKEMKMIEGGCQCCGYGGKQIPIEATEHEFVPKHNP